MRYPNVFAAVYCSEPMTNYREASSGSDADWVGDDLVPKWGGIAANLGIENRGCYAAHLAPYDGMGVWDWQNHQAQLVARAYLASSLMTLPRDVNEIPCWRCAPIMTDSMMGGFTFCFDFHWTMKLAPEPPVLSDSLTTYRVDAIGFKPTGFSMYFFSSFPLES